MYNGDNNDSTNNIDNTKIDWSFVMSKQDLDAGTPQWFRLWVANHFWHLKFKVDLLLWVVGVILVSVISTAVKLYFFP